MWQFLSNKFRPRVRSSALCFASQFLQHIDAEVYLPQIVPSIFEMIDEDNSIIQSYLWKDVFFTLGSKYPKQMVATKKLKSSILKCLRNAAYGAAGSLYTNLLKFISVFPGFAFQADFITGFFQAFLEGHKLDEAAN